MLPAPIPEHEAARLDALLEYQPSEPFEFEPYTKLLALAQTLFEVPTAYISLVGRDVQTFPVALGPAAGLTPRAISFSAHAVASGELLVVLDAVLDPRFADNPLVLEPPYLRFYAGAPLVSPSGHAVGAFCIADTVPHISFDEGQRRDLLLLATLALDVLEQRRLDGARRAGRVQFQLIAANSPDSGVCAGADGRISFWNAAAERMFGYAAAEALGQPIDLVMPQRMCRGPEGGLLVSADSGGTAVDLAGCRSDGTEFPLAVSLSRWHDDDGPSFGAILRDLRRFQADHEGLVYAAHHDAVTDLANRALIKQRIAGLAEGVAATVLLVGLEGFQTLKAELGRATGDQVLRIVAERLLACVRSSDTVARLGGDQFALLLSSATDDLRASRIASSIITSLSTPIGLADRLVTVGASVGVAAYPSDGATIEALLSSAELDLYQAKTEGRPGFRSAAADPRDAPGRGRAYGKELRRAYEEGEFEVFYQPQICLRDGALIGAEALLRWRHPVDGLLTPAAFIATLEHRPISARVGQLVLRTACLQAAEWRRAGSPQFRIGVNLFGSQFTTGTLAKEVIAALLQARLPPSALELEITENVMLRHDESMVGPLRELQARGVSVAFDDFGTGYGSLSMLKRFPIARLKVDQSFVRGMCESPEDAAIVRCIMYLGRAFGFNVIAEGVETVAQAEQLAADGCEEAQGYLYGRPMPAAEFTARFGLDKPDPLMIALADAAARRHLAAPRERASAG
jgi:diguanylate cyclase (GGDEF)-like protein/PAS domain S-box-containing protein